MMYECVSARFWFFNGKDHYTVEFAYGLSTWYVFRGQMKADALWWKEINPSKNASPTRMSAESILEEYLETLTTSKLSQ